jgi:hypothetical protein
MRYESYRCGALPVAVVNGEHLEAHHDLTDSNITFLSFGTPRRPCPDARLQVCTEFTETRRPGEIMAFVLKDPCTT